MWPFKKRNTIQSGGPVETIIQNWIDERLKEAESIFQGGDINLSNFGSVTNSSEAIAAFVALSIKVKEAAHNDKPIGWSMSNLATFLQFKKGKCQALCNRGRSVTFGRLRTPLSSLRYGKRMR